MRGAFANDEGDRNGIGTESGRMLADSSDARQSSHDWIPGSRNAEWHFWSDDGILSPTLSSKG